MFAGAGAAPQENANASDRRPDPNGVFTDVFEEVGPSSYLSPPRLKLSAVAAAPRG
jgi:hypothetical protein